MVTALATREEHQTGALAIWDRDELDVIKNLICPGASDNELKLFGQVCQKTGLDPFSRQIYGIMRGQRQQVNGEWKSIEKLSIQTSIDGFRLIAERSGRYGGQIGPQWCGQDGVWRDVWFDEAYPSAARVGVIRTDWKEPLWAVATWKSYAQSFKNKQGTEVIGAMWQKMPDVMLAKVAESLALRRAFPAELSGLYTSEEMQQADRPDPAPAADPPAPVVRMVKPAASDVIQPEPTPKENARAKALVGEEARQMPRPVMEAEYTRLAKLAVARGHKDAAKVKNKAAKDLDDDVLAASVGALQTWERKLPPVESADEDAAF